MTYFTKEKRYNTLSNYYKETTHQKVFKIPLNGGFSCPNIDGTTGRGGCTFCHAGSGDFAGSSVDPLAIQFSMGKERLQKKWGFGLYIAYFQVNTNTHGPLEKLKRLFEEAITLDEDIIMLSIATRPDALNDEIITYLKDLNTRIPVQIELGLQTIHQKTALFINRAHDLTCFDEAVKKLRKARIEVVVHIINGLPYETKNMMLETIKHLNTLDIQGLKIHMLHVMRQTKMGYDYLKKPFPILSLEAYVDIIVHQLRLLKPTVIIHRVTGDAPKELLIEPKWTLKKFVVQNEIDKLMRKKGYTQGDLYE